MENMPPVTSQPQTQWSTQTSVIIALLQTSLKWFFWWALLLYFAYIMIQILLRYLFYILLETSSTRIFGNDYQIRLISHSHTHQYRWISTLEILSGKCKHKNSVSKSDFGGTYNNLYSLLIPRLKYEIYQSSSF